MDMGKQQVQQEAGMRSEAQADRSPDSSESVGSGSQQHAPLKWNRMKLNEKFKKDLVDSFQVFVGTVKQEKNRMEKQVRTMRKIRNV